MTENHVLTVENAAFGYGKELLFDGLSFAVRPGEIVAVLGPNGAGKTTLLKCLMGMLKLKAGEVRIFGKDIRTQKERALFDDIAYVPQNRDFPASYTVLESVLIGLTGKMGIFSQPGKAEIEKAEETLRILGIPTLSEKAMSDLSGGEVQMVLLARALVKEPKILILDEPESGLDFKNQMIVLEAVKEAAGRGVAAVFNTHYPEHAFRYADSGLLFCPEEGDMPAEILTGPIEELITEKNIKKSFGVEAVIGTVEKENTAVKSVVPIKLSYDEEEN